MNCLFENSTLMLQKSMNYLWTKQSCIFDNIANAETPGYKQKYASFEESLDNAIRSAAKQDGTASQIRSAIDQTRIEIEEAPQSVRADDNGVDITEQSVELARNGYQLQYVMDAISSDFSILRAAIGR